jgi:hypothetical protein
MQILMSSPWLEGCLVSVVQELGGPKLDTDTFEDIVAKPEELRYPQGS